MENGALADARDDLGNTPLMSAAKLENIKLVRLLLKFGADPYATDKHGHTIFDQLELFDEESKIKRLLERLQNDCLFISPISVLVPMGGRSTRLQDSNLRRVVN